MKKNQTTKEIPNSPDPGKVKPETDPNLDSDQNNPINPKNEEPNETRKSRDRKFCGT